MTGPTDKKKHKIPLKYIKELPTKKNKPNTKLTSAENHIRQTCPLISHSKTNNHNILTFNKIKLTVVYLTGYTNNQGFYIYKPIYMLWRVTSSTKYNKKRFDLTENKRYKKKWFRFQFQLVIIVKFYIRRSIGESLIKTYLI